MTNWTTLRLNSVKSKWVKGSPQSEQDNSNTYNRQGAYILNTEKLLKVNKEITEDLIK